MKSEGEPRTDSVQDVTVRSGDVTLPGLIRRPPGAIGLVVFAHGSGSSRLSTRNNYVADVLTGAAIASLLFDLLTPEEEDIDRYSRQHRFDIELLTDRLIGATDWVADHPELDPLSIGYFGASTGAAAALAAAARSGSRIRAVVSRGGRPDLAADALPDVRSPTRLIVGGRDTPVIDLNRQAYERLGVEKDLVIVPGAGHLFEESGALEEVARLATDWFRRYLAD